MSTASKDLPFHGTRATDSQLEQAIQELREMLGKRCSQSESVLFSHGKGEAWHIPQPPDCVCFAESTEEVAAIVRICARHRVPLVPFGVGTNLEGHTLATCGGVSVDLSNMNDILEVNAQDMDCRVQAGVTRKQLNTWLRDTGLFFPIDPGADATLGGMTATRASGTNAVRYGTMRENVMSLTFVNAQGEIVRTGGRSRKSSAGYDLTRLLVGSEGTLGIITEIGLRLYGLPESIKSAVINFPDLDAAVNTVIDTIQLGIPVARIELVDDKHMQALNNYSGMSYPVRNTLFLEFHGTDAYTAEQVEQFGELAEAHGGSDFQWASTEEERNQLWQARHDALWAIMAANPGTRVFATDVCVPISNLADVIGEILAEVDKSPLDTAIIGHAGDGNFHMVFCISPDDEEVLREVYRLNECLISSALARGGTCTGEHGIGTGKLKYMRREHGDTAITMMQTIKRALDPDNIMNPGKTIAIPD